MSLVTPAAYIGADEHTADVFRMALQGLLGGTGVVGSGLKVVHVSGELEVQVEPGPLYLPGTLGTSHDSRVNAGNQHASYSSLPEYFTTQGAYHTWLPEAAKLSVSTPSSSHERIDLVCAFIEDAEWEGSLNQAVLSVITGTPEASPKAPTPPKNSVVLAQYKVPVGATEILEANITDKRPFVESAGGSWGLISSTAGILGGSGGYTVAKEATGEYKVKWTVPLGTEHYAPIVTYVAGLSEYYAYVSEITAASFVVLTESLTGTRANQSFTFFVPAVG